LIQNRLLLEAAYSDVSVFALHAAALDSRSNVIHTKPTDNQLIDTVHGAPKTYDLPNLANTLGDKCQIENPVDAQR